MRKGETVPLNMEVYTQICGPLFRSIGEKVDQVLVGFAELRTALNNGIKNTLRDLDEADERIEAKVASEVAGLKSAVVGLKKAFWWAMGVFGLATIGWVVTLLLEMAKVRAG